MVVIDRIPRLEGSTPPPCIFRNLKRRVPQGFARENTVAIDSGINFISQLEGFHMRDLPI
ncbi:MAG: hypothetical protein M2R45_05175 [Verrucomicrobia subdivision 3 bacterium]|nr:hypothetical protein [Limisphaerales bacterium]MCS1416295.1 hypothetical protein [Limisphaerales bacterium]